MKLWHVSPQALATSLLSRQHQTTHLLLSVIASGKEMGGMSRYSQSAGFVAWVHLECAGEMILRGMHHDSPIHPLWSGIPVRQRKVDIYIPSTRYLLDRRELATKMSGSDKGGKMDDARMTLDVGIRKFAEGLALAVARGLPANALVI